MRRIIPAIAVLALVTAACAGGNSGSPTTTAATTTTVPTPAPATSAPATSLPAPTTGPAATPEPATTPGPVGGAFPQGPSALDSMNAPEFPEPLVDVTAILSGGPPPDGIPPIDAPVFTSVVAADEWIDDAEPVVVIEIGGDERAYPVQILIWHEIVNDTVGGVPVAVTYCPLCNSAVSYRRTIEGVETTFGTSGRLFASALVMYDRATESLWTHFDGRAVVGVLTGRTLEAIPSPLISWSDFKVTHPDGTVLDRAATGYDRPYGNNPYVGYDNPDTDPFLFRGAVDDRAVAKQRVVGVALEDAAGAWALEAISGGAARATNADLEGRPLVILWKAGQASALDANAIADGVDVGSVGVFDPVVEGRRLTFTADGDGFVDTETDSRWDITGAAVSGDLAGTRLERIVHLDTFWFAWATYRPGTTLITE